MNPIGIIRTVHKIVFRWAFREVRGPEIDSTDLESKSGTPDLTRPNGVESYLLLQDFFQHCERTEVLTASEGQVFTKLKQEGLSAKQLEAVS